MFERFTDRARRVVALAQDEARRLNHDYIGTEHILLGLIHEGGGVAAEALESLGISLHVVRQEVEQIIGRGREALQLGHNYIGTEHILLGLIREADGVAAQVLVKLGADLNRVRPRVIELISGQEPDRRLPQEGVPVADIQARLDAIEDRLAAVEQQVGTAADTSDLDGQIETVRGERHAAADAQEYEQAASLRDREKELLAARTAQQEQWAAARPSLPDLAERCQQLAEEIERLHAQLRQHDIDPQDRSA
jgi:ATP-dependent Clp protease ATP-binding subunit ClpC